MELVIDPRAPTGRNGLGTVHHVAMAIAEGEEQRRLREDLLDHGLHVTEVLDRQYFESIYFREPGGVLFEVATMKPGFLVDEARSALGLALKLPPWEEPNRAAIERSLVTVTVTGDDAGPARAATGPIGRRPRLVERPRGRAPPWAERGSRGHPRPGGPVRATRPRLSGAGGGGTHVVPAEFPCLAQPERAIPVVGPRGRRPRGRRCGCARRPAAADCDRGLFPGGLSGDGIRLSSRRSARCARRLQRRPDRASGTTWTRTASFGDMPAFFGCSDVDAHVPRARVEESASVFATLGARVTPRIYPGMGHLVNDDEIACARAILDEIGG